MKITADNANVVCKKINDVGFQALIEVNIQNYYLKDISKTNNQVQSTMPTCFKK
jgi:hypothetical protein